MSDNSTPLRKCPNCSATLRFEPAKAGLVCDYCGYSVKLEDVTAGAVEEIDFASAIDKSSTDWGINTHTVKCGQCGAVTINDAMQISGSCPFCGSVNIVENDAGDKTIAPNAVIPFKISKEEALKSLNSWFRKALFAPESFRKGKHLKDLTGVYVPYWTFDTDTVTRYSGSFGYIEYTKDSTRTKYRQRSGRHDEFIDDYLVSASRKIYGNKFFRHVSTFDKAAVIPYTPDVLAGFVAERYSIGLDEAWSYARRGISERMKGRAIAEERADCVDKYQATTDFSNVKFKYLLAPMWLASFQHDGKVYHIVMNGQNGMRNCTWPLSTLKVVLAIGGFILLFLLIFLGMTGLSFLSWFWMR